MAEMETMELSPRVEAREAKEPSVSTMLMNFSNEFDPYGALSTPLYQTSTFKQVSFEDTSAVECKFTLHRKAAFYLYRNFFGRIFFCNFRNQCSLMTCSTIFI